MLFSYRFLPAWLTFFKLNKTLHIIDYTQFRNQPHKVLQDIEDFLELDHKILKDEVMFSPEKQFFCKKIPHKSGLGECMSNKKGRNHPMIPPLEHRQLKEYFRKGNTMFFEAIQQDFGWNDYFELN